MTLDTLRLSEKIFDFTGAGIEQDFELTQSVEVDRESDLIDINKQESEIEDFNYKKQIGTYLGEGVLIRILQGETVIFDVGDISKTTKPMANPFNKVKTKSILNRARFAFKYLSVFFISAFIISLIYDVIHPLFWLTLFLGSFGVFGSIDIRLKEEFK